MTLHKAAAPSGPKYFQGGITMSDERLDNQTNEPAAGSSSFEQDAPSGEGGQTPPAQGFQRYGNPYHPGVSQPNNNLGGPPPYQPPPLYQQASGYQQNGPRDNYRWNFEDYATVGRQKPPKRNRGLMVFGVLLAAVLAVGIVALSGFGVYTLMTNPSEEMSSEAPLNPEQPSPDRDVSPELTIKDRPGDSAGSAVDGRLSTVDIAKKVRPAVVGISQYSDYNTFEPSGEGSGIIMSSDGYILTNAHVVRGAMGISVELDNGESYSAKLIGVDTKTDLAVLKIDAPGLVAAEFGNSDELEVGETVIAIGNPGGNSLLPGSVTQGIVSGVNRVIKEEGYTSNYIQVDAAINPGNSGGALVNQFGQVVGINSSKVADVDYEGIGFAIPINDAKPVVDDLMAYGYVKGRVKLGITVQEINEVTAQLNSIPIGLYVVNIQPSSSLAGTSMTRGDVITHVDGVRVETYDVFNDMIQSKAAGDEVSLTLYRWTRSGGRGQSIDVHAVLQEDIEKQADGVMR